MRKKLVFLLGCFVTMCAQAKTNVDIFQATVVLDNEAGIESEADARRVGFENVLLKATGDSAVLSNPVIEKALSNNQQYLAELGYLTVDEKTALNIHFNAKQIRNLLIQAQEPYWPNTRPSILVWLINDDGYERKIQWENDENAQSLALKSQASSRGLPLFFPIGDFDDITQVNTSELWGGFTNALSAASLRYSPDAILLVRKSGNDLRWSLYDQKADTLQSELKTPMTGSANGDEATTQLVGYLTEYYAKKDAVLISSQSDTEIRMDVGSIPNAAAFFKLEKALSSFNSVAKVELTALKGKQASFTVHLLAGEEEFKQEARAYANIIETLPPVMQPTMSNDSDVSALNSSIDNMPSKQTVSSTETSSNPTDSNSLEQSNNAEPELAMHTFYYAWVE